MAAVANERSERVLDMIFTPIDRENWSRKEYFDHYFKEVPCTYSITTKLDITSIKQQGFRLYPTLLYLIAKTVNRFDSFRTAFRADGSLVVYEEMSPCYTIFHKETETFSNIWTEYTASYAEFCRRYARDLERFGSVEKMTAKPGQPENSFTVSMLPWRSFEGFNLNIAGNEYLLPIFTIGKYQETDGGYFIPLAIQVHHAVCDGFHVCRFINALQASLDSRFADC